MSNGIIGFSDAGDAGFPSPAVWADCPNTLLVDKGLGYFAHVDGAGDIGSLPGLPQDSDTGTFTYDSGAVDPRAVLAAIGATDNNALAIHTSPLAAVAKSSGVKVWAEADIALNTLGDAGLFFGIAEKTGLVRDVVADNPSNSAAAGLIAKSLIGFVSAQASSAIASVDAVYRKSAGTVVTVKAGVATPVAKTFVRLGVRYDGRDRVKFYVDGVKVAEQVVDSTFDQVSQLGVVLGLKTGAAASAAVYYRFIRAAAQVSS